jgi:hypothetical protein
VLRCLEYRSSNSFSTRLLFLPLPSSLRPGPSSEILCVTTNPSAAHAQRRRASFICRHVENNAFPCSAPLLRDLACRVSLIVVCQLWIGD